MESSDAEVIGDAGAWLREGRQVYLVTVAHTWGAAPRPVGSLLAATPDGRVSGSVSGGCVEEDLLQRLRSETHGGPPRTICYGTTREEAVRYGLPCGGRLELVIESLVDPAALEGLNQQLRARRTVRRILDRQSGEATLRPAAPTEAFQCDGQRLHKVFGPAWQLLIIGAGHLSRYLTAFARPLDFHVTVCDPRTDQARCWQVPGAARIETMPDEAVMHLADRRTAVVTVAHDPRVDDMALMAALLSDAFYVGALGSRRTSRQRLQRLKQLDIPPQALARLRAPVGLPLGSHTPPEIALSIMAEITAIRNNRDLTSPGGIEHGTGEAAQPRAV